VSDFDSLNKWHPGFASDELVSGGNGKVGAVRKLTIKDGPTFTERLLAFDAAHHSYRYKIIESPLAVHRICVHDFRATGACGHDKGDLERELQAQELCRQSARGRE